MFKTVHESLFFTETIITKGGKHRDFDSHEE